MALPGESSAPSPPDRASRVLRVGIDTGGTFTDLAVREPDGTLRTCKARSTPQDPGLALLEGLRLLGHAGGAGSKIVHGTTVALNALLTGQVGKAALITNEGFVDLIEIDRQARPDLYALEPERPKPLIPRELRFELRQRSFPAGPDRPGQAVERLRPTDAEIEALCDQVVATGARSVAVCLLHSYADPTHERRVAEALRARDLQATASADLVQEYREAERFSTAVCNAVLIPVAAEYLAHVGSALGDTPLELLKSSGGGLPAHRAALEPVRVLLSGPAGGVVGAAHAAKEAGLGSIVTLDMGGTSTDVAFHDPARSLGSLGEEVRVAGHSIAVPTLDMHTIGCGGGSLARVDGAGILRVGPESAGADPGPVAFGRGGTEPTVTDAYVRLGRVPIAPLAEGFLAGELELDVDAVSRAFEALGKRLGVSGSRAAEAVVAAAGASMRRAAAVMTMQRGRDPRTTPLVAFGGGGGLAAAALAGDLGMPSALVPYASGVLSAYGMTRAERTAERSASVLRQAHELEPAQRAGLLARLASEAAQEVHGEESGAGNIAFETSLSLRYRGQSYELNLSGETGDIEAEFHKAHEARFGWRLDGHVVEVVTARVRAALKASDAPESQDRDDGGPNATEPTEPLEPLGTQSAIFDGAAFEVPIFAREHLTTHSRIQGPAIIAEYSGTTALPPGWTARVVGGRGLLLEPAP